MSVVAIRKQAVTSGTYPPMGSLVGEGAEAISPSKIMESSQDSG